MNPKVKRKRETKTPIIESPKTSRKEGLKAAFGLWVNKKETGEAISREIREANRKIT